MYCVKCGVKLADSEKNCPLCNTEVYHPDIIRTEAEGLYPKNKYPAPYKNAHLPQIIVTAVSLLAVLTVLLCDLQFSGGVTWSGYVMGALMLTYICIVLPSWFKDPNPVIFTPCAFAAIGLYLMYINIAMQGDWFLSFALPITGGICLIVTAVVTLLRYVRRGRLYIFGGAILALGAFMLLVEFLMSITFEGVKFIGWSFYPLMALALLGGLLIFLAIYRPARETMERKFFI